MNNSTKRLAPIIAVNPESYGVYGDNMGPELAGLPNEQPRLKMEVEFILDQVPGAFHQPDDLINWIMQNPYVTGVTFGVHDAGVGPNLTEDDVREPYGTYLDEVDLADLPENAGVEEAMNASMLANDEYKPMEQRIDEEYKAARNNMVKLHGFGVELDADPEHMDLDEPLSSKLQS